jgi:transcriptional regulator with XRE-family HTH domain
MHIGDNLKELRLKNNWSQKDVANRLRMSLMDYFKIETGCTDLSMTRLAELSLVFGVPIVDLLSFVEEEDEP